VRSPRSDPAAVGGGALARALRDPSRECLGTVVTTTDPVFAELAASRFDLVWIDLEHSALSPSDVQALVIAARAAGAFSLIRLAGPRPHGVGALLDTGVDGIVIPRVETAAAVEAIAAEFRFPPGGRRGYAARRGALVERPPRPEDRPCCIVQVESRRAVEDAASLAALEICDALVVGTSDLSFDLGTPMAVGDADMVGRINAVREAALAAGKGWGVAAGSESAELRRATGTGGTWIYASDIRMISEALDGSVARLRDGAR
jgi:4-hydroxy-2-oxoheptanedioate aldolase